MEWIIFIVWLVGVGITAAIFNWFNKESLESDINISGILFWPILWAVLIPTFIVFGIVYSSYKLTEKIMKLFK